MEEIAVLRNKIQKANEILVFCELMVDIHGKQDLTDLVIYCAYFFPLEVIWPNKMAQASLGPLLY